MIRTRFDLASRSLDNKNVGLKPNTPLMKPQTSTQVLYLGSSRLASPPKAAYFKAAAARRVSAFTTPFSSSRLVSPIISSRNYFTKLWVGQEQASPKAQMVLPSMLLATRSSSATSEGLASPATMRSLIFFIHREPSRQGVHWPQDS